MPAILVTGGAGYIGSHTVKVLVERGLEVVVLDSLITGHAEALPPEVPLYQGDISDFELLQAIVRKHPIDSVIHFAARSLVGESMIKPELYFHENTAKTNLFVTHLLKLGIHKLVFSSTAATYGLPEQVPMVESTPTIPINPYGLSKLMIEQSLAWFEKAHGLQWIALRYFNAAGASLDGMIGEDHATETHLIPLILKTALGQREHISIYGTDYPTPDGTCIRDYIHVLDLADVHILALDKLSQGICGSFNVGTGQGHSVREVIERAKGVTGIEFPIIESPRREGDPDSLVAGVDKIEQTLGWKARYSDLDTILESAWRWHRNNPNGYGR